MKTTYSVQMTDSDKPAAWMSLPFVQVTPGNQDSGKVRMTVTIAHGQMTQAELDAKLDTLEEALRADDDVLNFEVC